MFLLFFSVLSPLGWSQEDNWENWNDLGSFEDFSSAGVERIEALTGLTRSQAELANQREFSEPLAWHGSEDGLTTLEKAVGAAGGRVYRGGRFYTIAGETDKGKAYRWLRSQYAESSGGISVHDLCIGDGANDVPFLDDGEVALFNSSALLYALANALEALAAREDNPALLAYSVNLKNALIETVGRGIITGDLKGKTIDPDSEQIVDMHGFLDAVECDEPAKTRALAGPKKHFV